MFEGKIRKYKISSSDLRNADVIILDGIVYKDRYHSINGYGGSFSLLQNGDVETIQMKLFVGCETEDGQLRYYKNF